MKAFICPQNSLSEALQIHEVSKPIPKDSQILSKFLRYKSQADYEQEFLKKELKRIS